MFGSVWASVKSAVVKTAGWLSDKAVQLIGGGVVGSAAVAGSVSEASAAVVLPQFITDADINLLTTKFGALMGPAALVVLGIVAAIVVFKAILYWLRTFGH